MKEPKQNESPQTMTPDRDYRHYLEQVLRSRKARNTSYSLRSFARDLGISASRLSEIFHGKDGLSSTKAHQIADRLDMNPLERDRFVAMVEAQSARSPVIRRLGQERLASYTKSEDSTLLRDDMIASLQGWHHFAIVELSRTPDFKSQPRTIARRLGISEDLAKESVERLIRLGLIKKEKQRLVATGARFATASDIPSSVIRDYHASLLNQAMTAIDGQSMEERGLGASLFPVKVADLPNIKAEVQDALRAIVKKYEFQPRPKSNGKNESADDQVEVYCLANQLFRLSKRENEHEAEAHH